MPAETIRRTTTHRWGDERTVDLAIGRTVGLALVHATFFRQGYQEQFGLGPAEVIPVVVFRHLGTSKAFNDALRAKYALGERSKVVDAATGKDALRNPFIHAANDEKNATVPGDASIEALLANGAVILVCNRTTKHLGGQVAAKFGKRVEECAPSSGPRLFPAYSCSRPGCMQCCGRWTQGVVS